MYDILSWSLFVCLRYVNRLDIEAQRKVGIMTDFEIKIVSDVFPEYATKVSGSIDFRLAVAKVMGDWNMYCLKQRKDDTPEVTTITITATSSDGQ